MKNSYLKIRIGELMKIALMMIIPISLTIALIVPLYAESFSNYSSFGGSTERSPNKKAENGCYYFTCGPTSTIKLSTASPSPSIDMHNYSIGDNSTLEQMMKMGEGFGNFDPTKMMEQMGIPTQGVKESKEIVIDFPLIDYGFSGSFNNISIGVTGGYASVITGLTDKDDTLKYTGKLTIEKYNPFVIKGSYSGTLYKYKYIPPRDLKCPAYSDPSTPPCVIAKLVGTGKISGQFNIVSPWKDDERINKNIDQKSSFIDPFKNDLKGMVATFGIDIDIDKEFEKAGVGDSDTPDNSNTSKVADIYGGCNCSCNYVNSASTQCKMACSAAFSACNGDRYKPEKKTEVSNNINSLLLPNLSTKSTLPKVKGATLQGIDQDLVDILEKGSIKAPKNIREKFISLLQKSHPGQANAPIRDIMIKGFDEMPDETSKVLMFKSLGGN